MLLSTFYAVKMMYLAKNNILIFYLLLIIKYVIRYLLKEIIRSSFIRNIRFVLIWCRIKLKAKQYYINKKYTKYSVDIHRLP